MVSGSGGMREIITEVYSEGGWPRAGAIFDSPVREMRVCALRWQGALPGDQWWAAARRPTVGPMMSIPLVTWKARLAGYVRGFGPYVAIGLLVPGGLFILLLGWFFRHRRVGS